MSAVTAQCRTAVVSTPGGNIEVRRVRWRGRDGLPEVRWHVRPVGLAEWTPHELLRVAIALACGFVEPPLPEWIDRVAAQARTEIGATA